MAFVETGTQTEQRSEERAASDPQQAQGSDLVQCLEESETQLRQLDAINSEKDETILRLRDQEQAIEVERRERMEETREVHEVEVENEGGFWSTFKSGAKKVATASLWAVPAVAFGFGIYALTR
uniref:Uncharacterized protein n=1 Tax=Knipowitschia caucasica TaxID=637954 RepID=A0AAV2K8S6_KNICA